MEGSKILPRITRTRNLILRGFAGVYLAAFISFYIQAEGLFHPVDGIVPQNVAPLKIDGIKDLHDKILEIPSLIKVLRTFGIPTFASIEILALSGALISLLSFISLTFCIAPMFFIMWYCYYSLITSAGPFHQQCDDLLLEAGVVAFMLAPGFKNSVQNVSDNVFVTYLRWVLFRFLFTSGAVKLASGCPHWWNLSALKHHFLTLPLPTHIAFYSFYIPEGLLKLSVVYVQLTELLTPWLFFAPVRSLRIFAFYWNVFLQINIIISGNYGFLNFLVLTLLLSLLDDAHFEKSRPDGGVNYKKLFSVILTFIAIFFIAVITLKFYKITWENGKVDAAILINREEYMNILRQMVKLSPFVVTISIINVFLQSCISHPRIVDARSFFKKLLQFIYLVLLTLGVMVFLGASTVPHGRLHPETNISNTSIGEVYSKFFVPYHFVNEYGLHLRKMRSERMELGFQYTESESLEKGKAKWKEYDVTYRPVNKNHSLPFAGLFFSRIDFKFHEAVGKGAKLEKNLWLAGLMKQLLRNNRAALMLLGHENLLKLKMPPKFIRLAFMKVSYVPLEDAKKNAGLWTRKILNADYLPPMSISSPELKALLDKLNLPKKKEKENYPKLLELLEGVRAFFEATDGHLVVNGIVVASLLIMFRLRGR